MKDYSVGESLKRVRKEHNFKQKEVAEAIGVDRSTYSFYEIGRTNPSLETLCTLAKIYNVTIGYLIGKEANNPELRENAAHVSAGVDPNAMLKKDEQLLLMYYRVADEATKKEIFESLTGKLRAQDDKNSDTD